MWHLRGQKCQKPRGKCAFLDQGKCAKGKWISTGENDAGVWAVVGFGAVVRVGAVVELGAVGEVGAVAILPTFYILMCTRVICYCYQLYTVTTAWHIMSSMHIDYRSESMQVSRLSKQILILLLIIIPTIIQNILQLFYWSPILMLFLTTILIPTFIPMSMIIPILLLISIVIWFLI